VGKDRAAEAGMNLIRDGAASYLSPALEHKWLESGFREVIGSDESVVAAAKNQDITRLGHG
jgi:hypothetical protein